MKMFLIALSMLISSSTYAQGKAVIYIQKLLDNNPSGVKTLLKEAQKLGVVLEWEGYVTRTKWIENPVPAVGRVDFLLQEVVSVKTKNEWKNYRVLKYALLDANTQQVIAYSNILREKYVGGCNDVTGMCEQVQGDETLYGASKTKDLVGLLQKAKELVR